MRNLIKDKKASEVIGMSFSTIFSIILIVFFIISAFIGIKAFLNYQKCAQIGLYKDDFQSEINTARNAFTAVTRFNQTLPTGIEYVCVVNTTDIVRNASNVEQSIMQYIQDSSFRVGDNLFFYAPDKDYCTKWTTIKYVDLSSHNPICTKVIHGIASFKIERKYEGNLVTLSA